MSWGIQAVGYPEALKKKIDRDVEGYSGQSKLEFAEAAPHLKGLLDQADPKAVVSLTANGHVSLVGGEKTSAYIHVKLEQLGLMHSE